VFFFYLDTSLEYIRTCITLQNNDCEEDEG